MPRACARLNAAGTTPTTAVVVMAVIVAALALTAWALWEGLARGNRWFLLVIPATYGIGVSAGLPLALQDPSPLVRAEAARTIGWRPDGAAMASDAFFPFRDGIDVPAAPVPGQVRLIPDLVSRDPAPVASSKTSDKSTPFGDLLRRGQGGHQGR